MFAGLGFGKQAPPLPKNPGSMPSGASSGDFFIRNALTMLTTSKEYKRNEPLQKAILAAFGISNFEFWWLTCA